MLHTNLILARRDGFLRASSLAQEPDLCASLRSLPVSQGSLFGGLAGTAVDNMRRVAALKQPVRRPAKRRYGTAAQPAPQPSEPPSKRGKQGFQRGRGGQSFRRGRGGRQPGTAASLGPSPKCPPSDLSAPPQHGSAVGSLARHLEAWIELPASDWAVGIIRSGYRLPWKAAKAPLSPFPISFPPPRDPEAIGVLSAEVRSLLEKGAIEAVSSPARGFYGRIFVVPKSSGGWRPVLDLSTLNGFLTDLRFRMETPSSVRASVHSCDWAVPMDLTDAYFHILIHPADRKFLRFVWMGQVFQYRALPFGLAPAPWLFTKITRELCRAVRGKGLRLRVYLDDWLLLAPSQDQCASQCRQVLELCSSLGFVLNREKSDLTPSQRFVYLGMAFDTVAWAVSPAPNRLSRLQLMLSSLLSRPTASARQLASLLGALESLSLLLGLPSSGGGPRHHQAGRLRPSSWHPA